MIRGNDDNNRETSDAPLWFFVACDELMTAQGNKKLLKEKCGERTLKDVLISLATGLINGTENGISGSSFDFATNILHLPNVEVEGMGYYNVKLKRIENSAPMLFMLDRESVVKK